MAKTIGCLNEKGGVGKTTTNKNVAEYAALVMKVPTLLIGMDPQMNLAARYLEITKNPISGKKEPPVNPMYDPNNPEFADWNGKSSSADIFFGEDSNSQIIPYPTKYENLDILPADAHKLDQLKDIKNQGLIERITMQLCSFLAQPAIQDSYKLIVIDSPPTQGVLSQSTLNALTHLVIPLEIEAQPLEGLDGIITLWYQASLARPADRPLRLIGVLPNKVHPTRGTDKDLLAELRSDPSKGKHIFPNNIQIGDRKDIPESDLLYKSLFHYPDSSKDKQEMLAACSYIYKEIFNG